MSKISDEFKKEFNQIEVDNSTLDKIENNIYHKYNSYKRRKKIVVTVVSLFLVAIVSTGIVYADDIKNYVRTFKFKEYIKDNGKKGVYGKSECFKKVINYDAPLDEVDTETDYNKNYKIKDIEDMLNIKILKSKYLETEEIKQLKTYKINNKISYTMFSYNTGKNNNNNIIRSRMSKFYFVTKYSSGECGIEFNSSGSLKATEYYVKNLDTNAYIFNFSKGFSWDYIIFVIYDGINYSFVISINPIKVNTDELQEYYLHDFLESLHY